MKIHEQLYSKPYWRYCLIAWMLRCIPKYHFLLTPLVNLRELVLFYLRNGSNVLPTLAVSDQRAIGC